jgi:integrase
MIVDGYCKKNGQRTTYNKKGSPDNPKFRIVFLADITLEKLQNRINENGLQPDDYVFTGMEGRPVRTEYAEDIFDRALVRAGLNDFLKAFPV